MNDFEYSISLLDSFFRGKKIQNSLNIIWDEEISGWEIGC